MILVGKNSRRLLKYACIVEEISCLAQHKDVTNFERLKRFINSKLDNNYTSINYESLRDMFEGCADINRFLNFIDSQKPNHISNYYSNLASEIAEKNPNLSSITTERLNKQFETAKTNLKLHQQKEKAKKFLLKRVGPVAAAVLIGAGILSNTLHPSHDPDNSEPSSYELALSDIDLYNNNYCNEILQNVFKPIYADYYNLNHPDDHINPSEIELHYHYEDGELFADIKNVANNKYIDSLRPSFKKNKNSCLEEMEDVVFSLTQIYENKNERKEFATKKFENQIRRFLKKHPELNQAISSQTKYAEENSHKVYYDYGSNTVTVNQDLDQDEER